MTLLATRGLDRRFGGVHAVRGVSFTARDGEITGIIGPNGAGKTTILRLVYTVLAPDAGSTLIDGIDSRLDRRSVSHWLAGRRPRSPLPELVAEAFARRFGRQISAAETGFGNSSPRRFRSITGGIT